MTAWNTTPPPFARSAAFREADRRLGDRVEEVNRRLGERIEDVDRRLAARIDALTVAIGQLLAGMGVPPRKPE